MCSPRTPGRIHAVLSLNRFKGILSLDWYNKMCYLGRYEDVLSSNK